MLSITVNIPTWAAVLAVGMLAISVGLDAWLKILNHRLDRLKRERADDDAR